MLITRLLQHSPGLCDSLVRDMRQVDDLGVLATQGFMALLKTIVTDDLTIWALGSGVARLVAQTTLAGEPSWLGALGLSVTFFTAVEATSVTLSTFRAVTSEVALCSRCQRRSYGIVITLCSP